MVELLYGQEPLNVSHYPTKFRGHWHSGCGDIMVIPCHVIL